MIFTVINSFEIDANSSQSPSSKPIWETISGLKGNKIECNSNLEELQLRMHINIIPSRSAKRSWIIPPPVCATTIYPLRESPTDMRGEPPTLSIREP